MTVELLKDLLESGEGDNELPQGKFFFAHSETFLPLLVALGVAKDEVGICEISFHLLTLLQPPLSVENMPADRKWRTSLIGGRQKQKCSWTMDITHCAFQESPQISQWWCTSARTALCHSCNSFSTRDRWNQLAAPRACATQRTS